MSKDVPRDVHIDGEETQVNLYNVFAWLSHYSEVSKDGEALSVFC